MKLRMLAPLVALAVVALGGAARADFTYEFANASGVAQSSFSVAAGASVNVQVYIVASGTDTLTSNGLTSAGVQLNTTTPTVANVTATTANPQFDSGAVTNTGANAAVSEFASAPVTSASTSNDRILVGTFAFTGTTPGQTLTVSALPGLSPDNTRADGTTIDAYLAANTVTAVITVTAVPEPGSLVLAGLAVAGFGAGVLRRRLGRKPEPTAVA